MPAKITELTAAQRAQMDAWADRWIEIGLRTGATNWEEFEHGARNCYGFAGIPWPGTVIRVSSPLALVLAAPIAATILESRRGAVDGAVRGAVRDAVDGAVDDAVNGAVRDAARDAVGDAVDGAVDGAVRGAVDGAVRGAVHDAVCGAVGGAVSGAVRDAIRTHWNAYLGGQFWVGGWGWGGAWTSFFREICHLDLPGDLWARGLAYEETLQSACWWWPHRQFIMVCARPVAIHRELVNPAITRGWGSHRLHCENGPAIVWPDGWGVYAWHGVQVPAWVIEQPHRITAATINAEPNVEVRRVMIERIGWERYLDMGHATIRQADDYGTLLELPALPNENEPLLLVRVTNSTPEPDGSFKDYVLRIRPTTQTAREAVAWTFGIEKPEDYELAMET